MSCVYFVNYVPYNAIYVVNHFVLTNCQNDGSLVLWQFKLKIDDSKYSCKICDELYIQSLDGNLISDYTQSLNSMNVCECDFELYVYYNVSQNLDDDGSDDEIGDGEDNDSDEESSEDGTEDGTNEDDDKDDDEDDTEPQLKYQRVGTMVKRDLATCLGCHLKLLVLGMASGCIFVTDPHGNIWYVINLFTYIVHDIYFTR